MEPQDFVQPEVCIAVAITAAVCSPKVRQVAWKGIIYAVASVLTLGEVVVGVTRSLGQEIGNAGRTAMQQRHHQPEPPVAQQARSPST